MVNGVYIEQSLITKMLRAVDNKPEAKNKFEWRMCATIVLKKCLSLAVPVLPAESASSSGKAGKNKFYV